MKATLTKFETPKTPGKFPGLYRSAGDTVWFWYSKSEGFRLLECDNSVATSSNMYKNMDMASSSWTYLDPSEIITLQNT